MTVLSVLDNFKCSFSACILGMIEKCHCLLAYSIKAVVNSRNVAFQPLTFCCTSLSVCLSVVYPSVCLSSVRLSVCLCDHVFTFPSGTVTVYLLF